MAFADKPINDALAAVIADGNYIALNSGDPGTTGANLLSGAPKATTWGTPASRSVSGSEVAIDVAAGESPTHISAWTAASGGSFLWGAPLASPPGTYSSAGTYKVTPTLNG